MRKKYFAARPGMTESKTAAVILRSRAFARRLEGWKQALVAHPSRLAAKGRRAPQDDDVFVARLLKIFSFINIKFFELPWIVIPAPRTCLILIASCPVRGAS
jgi:hypothetical protein